MALYTKEADIVGEYEAAVGALSDTKFVDIEAVLDWAVSNRMLTQRDFWLRPANYGSAPNSDDDYWWLLEGGTSTPPLSQGLHFMGSGNNGGGRSLDAVDGRADDNLIGPGTRITRNDTHTGTPDLTWPFFKFQGVGDKLSNMYLRGVYDSDNISTEYPQPEVAVEIDKGSGVGTGRTEITDCVFQHFDRGIDIGANTGSNSDNVLIKHCMFDNVGTCIRTNHVNVIGVFIKECVTTSSCDILVDCVNGGMFTFHDLQILQDDLTVLKVRDSNLNPGQFNFYGLKVDNVGSDSLIVDMTTSEVNMFNDFNFFGGKDSRIMQNGDHAATFGNFHGNCDVNIFGWSGVGDIVVSGGNYSGGNTYRSLAAPFINLIGCKFRSEAVAKDPRLLLKKPNGEQAIEGVDYSGLYWSGCKAMISAGTPKRFGQLVTPGNGGSNYAFTPDKFKN